MIRLTRPCRTAGDAPGPGEVPSLQRAAQHVLDVVPGEVGGAQQARQRSPLGVLLGTAASLLRPAATGSSSHTAGWHGCGSRPPRSARAWPGSLPVPAPAASSRWRSVRSAAVPARQPGQRAGAAAAARPRLFRGLRGRARAGVPVRGQRRGRVRSPRRRCSADGRGSCRRRTTRARPSRPRPGARCRRSGPRRRARSPRRRGRACCSM